MATEGIAGKRHPVWDQGPAFAALTDREQRFVLAMAADPFAGAAGWARAAGYACHDGAKVTGHRVLKRGKVEAAVFEVARSLMGTVGPLLAANVMLRIASDSEHPRQLRAAEMIADRVGMHSIQEVHVSRTDETLEGKISRIHQLAALLGVPVSTLLGANVTQEPKPEPKVIEHIPAKDAGGGR
jgi:hypothetical protein